jgi:hypothetical protein
LDVEVCRPPERRDSGSHGDELHQGGIPFGHQEDEAGPNEREKDHPGQEVIWQHLSILPFQFYTATLRFYSGQLAASSWQIFKLTLFCCQLSAVRCLLKFRVTASLCFSRHNFIE